MSETASANTLWLPGQSLLGDPLVGNLTKLESPSAAELASVFHEHALKSDPNAQLETIETPGTIGVLRKLQPGETPSGLLLVDSDEVLINMYATLQGLIDGNVSQQDLSYIYAVKGLFTDKDVDQGLKWSTISLLKNSLNTGGGIRPVPDVDRIRQVVSLLQSVGVYVVILTATHPGSELGQTRISTSLIPADGVMISRGGHQGANKGDTALEALGRLNLPDNTPIAFIDDGAGNLRSVREAVTAGYPRLNLATFQHVYPHDPRLIMDNDPTGKTYKHRHGPGSEVMHVGKGFHAGEDEQSTLSTSSLDAFLEISRFFREAIGHKHRSSLGFVSLYAALR